MSENNEELVRRMLDAWNARDEEVVALVHPEFEYENAPSAVEPGTRHGPQALLAVLRTQWSMLGDEARMKLDELHTDGEQVVTAATLTRSMPGSDVPIEGRIAIRWTFRQGRVLRMQVLGAGSEFRSAFDDALAQRSRGS